MATAMEGDGIYMDPAVDPNKMYPPGEKVADHPQAAAQGSMSENAELTVQVPGRVEAGMNALLEAGQAPSRVPTVCKWLVMFILMLSLLACLTSNKITLIHLTTVLETARKSGSHDTPGDDGAESLFLMLLLLMMIPAALSLFRCLWSGALRSDKPWPSPKAFIAIIVSSVLESFGMTLLILDVLPVSPNYISVLLMNGVFLIPIFYTIVLSYRDGLANNKLITGLCISALILEILGIVLTFVFELSPEGVHNSKIWEIPVALICLSIAWCPPILHAQTLPTKKTLLRLMGRTHCYGDLYCTPEVGDINSVNTNVDDWSETQSPGTSLLRPEACEEDGRPRSAGDINVWEAVSQHPEYCARWKSGMIIGFLRLILLPGFAILVGYAWKIIDVHRLHDGLNNLDVSHPLFQSFLVCLLTGFVGYLLAWVACVMCLHIIAFAVPLTLTTPISFILIMLIDTCKIFGTPDSTCVIEDKHNLKYTLPAAVCLYVAQLLSTGFFIFKTHNLIMQKESRIFWQAGYNGVLLEQWLLLNRKNERTDYSAAKKMYERAKSALVFICTTMYREDTREMEQLVRSLKRINSAKQIDNRNFQAHIFFDNGCRGKKLTQFALQLVHVVKEVLECTPLDCTKVITPYGMKHVWKLPEFYHNSEPMLLVIHFKDNTKVKNKKRWSQVMYMSYVLDYFVYEKPDATYDNTFILATDADVMFGPESVEALLDLMIRDTGVGAVCARTHPTGSGPVVWYQIFDYAIGHWLQKVGNDILGSVLCCPGCFSVYRAQALADVLATYASSVNEASEFLTKDMGEDRWLCTLMVQSGWRLEYCAAASDTTYCPEEFDEFFKQRRRWIPSTLANQFLLLSQWKRLDFFNKQISYFFLFYQAALLFSTLINPSVSIMIIVGGMYYAWSVDQVVSTVLLITVVVGFTIICLKNSQETQLLVAKLLTIGFALIMAGVTIGTAVKEVQENVPAPPDLSYLFLTHDENTTATTSVDEDENHLINMSLSVSTIYLIGLTGIFVVTALMHLTEAYCLLHGIWYLLCLPAGNIILLIYSLCNITDRSWGTREEKKKSAKLDLEVSWGVSIKTFFQNFWLKCRMKNDDKAEAEATAETSVESKGGKKTKKTDRETDDSDSDDAPTPRQSKLSVKIDRSLSFRFHSEGAAEGPIPVGQWLSTDFKSSYTKNFVDNGYDDTTFVAGMSDHDLKTIGISSPTHRNSLLAAIKQLPDADIDPDVPDTVDSWLVDIGLPMYKDDFRRAHIITSTDMEQLKTMDAKQLRKVLKIVKEGHLKRLIFAIQRLRHPTETERAMNQVKDEIDALTSHNLEQVNKNEHDFWERLRQHCLLPDSVAFAHDHDLKEKLTSLRNQTLIMFAITNVIWVILISTLATKGELNVLGTNALGLSFLVIFGLLLVIQFISMICHRLSTWMHMIARAPYCYGQPTNDMWSFYRNVPKAARTSNLQRDEDDEEAEFRRNAISKTMQQQFYKSVQRRKSKRRKRLCTIEDTPTMSTVEELRP